MKINLKVGDKVAIEWKDACSCSAWVDLQEALKIPDSLTFVTRGFFVGQKEGFVIIAGSMNTKVDRFGDVIYVPEKWIKKVK